MKIIDYIPVGHKNAVTRKQLVILNRTFRPENKKYVQEECNREHPILNMQDGKGYFQPAYDEMHLVRLYRVQENHRTLTNRKKVSEIDKYLKCQNNELERNQISISDVIGGGK